MEEGITNGNKPSDKPSGNKSSDNSDSNKPKGSE